MPPGSAQVSVTPGRVELPRFEVALEMLEKSNSTRRILGAAGFNPLACPPKGEVVSSPGPSEFAFLSGHIFKVFRTALCFEEEIK